MAEGQDDLGNGSGNDNGNGNGNDGQQWSGLAGLTELIAKQNPYTTGRVDDMDIYLRPPVDCDPKSQIVMEVDGDYPGEWSFKGIPQKLNRVIRLQYRCKVRRPGGSKREQNPDCPADYWMTAYLLIGFEDGGM